jgi:hypothetical protein
VVRIGLTKPRVRLVWVVAPELLMIDGLDMLTRPLNAGLPAHYDPLCLYIAESPCQIPSQDCCRTRLVGYSLTGTRSITEWVAERAVAVVLSGSSTTEPSVPHSLIELVVTYLCRILTRLNSAACRGKQIKILPRCSSWRGESRFPPVVSRLAQGCAVERVRQMPERAGQQGWLPEGPTPVHQ